MKLARGQTGWAGRFANSIGRILRALKYSAPHPDLPPINRHMINRDTGEVGFKSGLLIVPHCPVEKLAANAEAAPRIRTQDPSLKGWKRHVFGFHVSEHGTFEVEALLSDGDRIQIVLLAHRHTIYEPNTPEDADRRAFHEGVISSDLAGQREFAWGEVLHRLEPAPNKDWLVVAYSREAKVPLPDREAILTMRSHERFPAENI